MQKNKSIFVIRDVNTGEFISYGSKCAWISKAAAKGAYANHNFNYKTYSSKKFDDQKDLVIEEIV